MVEKKSRRCYNLQNRKTFFRREKSAMSYIYKTQGTCSTQIEVELDGDIVKDVKFTGGCHGNLQAIPRLVEGMSVDEVERRISGIHCGMKNTSCGDQLAKALREAYNSQNA
jgi:uncharacterized protein (TIGR03905 family)